MKKKNNKIIILILIGVIFVVSLLVFILNYSKDDTSYTLLEKKWLKDNSNNVIDVSVYNDVSIFGENGSGVIFDYLESFYKEYGINFNKVSYLSSNNNNSYKNLSFRVIDSSKEIGDNDILLYTDKYVIVSKSSEVITDVNDLSNMKLATLGTDLSIASYYLNGSNTITYKSYDKVDNMIKDLNEGVIDALLLPFNQYLSVILDNNLNIIYHVSDINKKYVITVNDNSTLFNILEKYTKKYLNEKYDEVYRTNFLNVIFSGKDISEEEKMNYNANSYTYGYVNNVPFEVKEDDTFGGTISNYLGGFEDLFNVDFKYVRYDDIDSLKNALSSGEVDMVFGDFNTDGVNIDRIFTSNIFDEKYVILSSSNNYLSTIRSLKNKEVCVVKNSYLKDYLSSNGVISKEYVNTEDLLRNIDGDSTLMLDYDTYKYYKNNKLSSYNINYMDSIKRDYRFVIRDVNKNSTFSKLFSFYITMIDYNDIRYNYNISTNYISNNFGELLKIFALVLVLTLVIVGIVLFTSRKKKNKDKVIKKDEKLKFIDVMTSLKNRNYLNYNMEKWDENVIYPQSIVVIDLNNIKYVNDNYGHEEGDNVIKKAANILIINQLENTDIIRTDGNEFLIYIVGYDEKDVISYTRKIYKELKELPYGFGASIGYSMILDDIKTIDDAINEATLEMRKAKEQSKN